MTAGASRAEPTITRQPALAPYRHDASGWALRRRSAAAWLAQRAVRDDSTLPPEILLFGANPEVKCNNQSASCGRDVASDFNPRKVAVE
jgi:hypothetical protein